MATGDGTVHAIPVTMDSKIWSSHIPNGTNGSQAEPETVAWFVATYPNALVRFGIQQGHYNAGADSTVTSIKIQKADKSCVTYTFGLSDTATADFTVNPATCDAAGTAGDASVSNATFEGDAPTLTTVGGVTTASWVADADASYAFADGSVQETVSHVLPAQLSGVQCDNVIERQPDFPTIVQSCGVPYTFSPSLASLSNSYWTLVATDNGHGTVTVTAVPTAGNVFDSEVQTTQSYTYTNTTCPGSIPGAGTDGGAIAGHATHADLSNISPTNGGASGSLFVGLLALIAGLVAAASYIVYRTRRNRTA
jgi:hypothetical protein